MFGNGSGTPGSGSHRPSSAVSSSSSLPSYTQAMGQTIEVSTPPSTADYGGYPEELLGEKHEAESNTRGGTTTDGIASDIRTTQYPTSPRAPDDEQLATITELQKQPLQKGASWYLVPSSWWRTWSQACTRAKSKGQSLQKAVNGDSKGEGETEVPVGPVPMHAIADVNDGALRIGLQEGVDFEVVPEEAWTLLVSWYGYAGSPIGRRAIVPSPFAPLRLELFPPTVYLFTASASPAELAKSSFSITQPVRDVLHHAAKAMEAMAAADEVISVQPQDIRLWRLPDAEIPAAVPSALTFQEPAVELVETKSDDVTLFALQIDLPVVRMAVERKQADGTWLFTEDGILAAANKSVRGVFKNDGGDYLTKMHGRDNGMTGLGSVAADVQNGMASQTVGRVTRSQTAAERHSEKQRGLTGLYNLGNTCFMNSALQCMSNTKELKDYFVSGVYKTEVNADNPLGMGGAIAKVFGELLAKLWSAGGGAVHPREFKMILSRFSPQFIGYAQQDTQELLAFLLDGLHEDLNRIVKKPYIEAPDWEGGGIREMVNFAHKQWEIYKMRNDSVIVDLFQGQYRSTLVCPDCNKVSIKFDPFMYLTLPIPDRKITTRKVTYIGFDGKQLFEAEILLRGEVSIAGLKQKVADIAEVGDSSRLLAVDYFQQSFYRVLGDFESAKDIAPNDTTYIYDMLSPIRPIAPLSTSAFASHSSLRLAELEKTNAAPAEATNLNAILPVFTVESHSHAHRRHAEQSIGRPFFINLPADKINDPAAIQEAIFAKYELFAQDKTALWEALGAHETARSSASTSQEDWDMMDDDSIVISNARHLQQEDTVAEISDEGKSVRIVPDNRRSNGLDKTPSSVTHPLEHSAFQIYFHVQREDGAPVTGKPNDYHSRGQEIWARSARQRKQKIRVDAIDADGDTIQSDAPPASHNNGPEVSWPLVYSGGALICEWKPGAREQIFGNEHDANWLAGCVTVTDPELDAERQPGKKVAKRSLTIDDCLDEFTKEERLGQSDPWYCPQCKDFKQASKKFDLWKVPDILVVHLKRFSSGRISRDKIDSVIDFPITELDLTNRVEGAKAVRELHEDMGDDDKMMESVGSLDANDDAVEADAPIYDLYAVDNHYGGLGGGHYTAYAKNPEDGKWYYFDDSSVRPANVEDAKSSAAYLLFYRRRTTRPIGGKSQEKVRESVNNSRNNSNSNSDIEEGPSKGGESSTQRHHGSGDTSSHHQSTSGRDDDVTLDQWPGDTAADHGPRWGAGQSRLAHDSEDYGFDRSHAPRRPLDDSIDAECDVPSWRSMMDTADIRAAREAYTESDDDSLYAALGDSHDQKDDVDEEFSTASDFRRYSFASNKSDSSTEDNGRFRNMNALQSTGISSPISRVPTYLTSGGAGNASLSAIMQGSRVIPTS